MGSASPARIDARIEAAHGNPQPISLIGRCRIGVRGLGMLASLIVLVPLHYLWRLLRLSSPWPRIFLGWAGYCSGARVTRHGTPLKRDVFFVSNHVSWVDILAIAGASGTAFVAKAELAKAPIVGWLASLNRTVYVSREDRLGVAEQINKLKDALAENWSVTVFPEGTTTDGRSMLPFKPPLLKVLEPPPARVLVQPVMLDYGEVGPDISWIGDEAGLHNALRVLARPGSFALNITFLDPFDPHDFPGRKLIAAESHRRIREALAGAIGHDVPTFIGHDVWAGRGAAPTPAPLEGDAPTQ